MSRFNLTSTFFKNNQTQKLNIITKVAQKEVKKNKKFENNSEDKSFNVSENEFDKLMEENDTSKISQEKLSSYMDKITDSDILTKLVQEEIKGEELVNKLKYENVSGSQLLTTILKKYNDPNNLSWINKNEYCESLYNALENNLQEQLLCLLVIQNYCIQIGMPKITYKDKPVYYIKLIFQLMFTQDIIDESVYWTWQELSSTFIDIDEDTKNKICIQSTDFFNILKISFTEEDYENNENNENNNKQELKKEPVYRGETEIESETEIEIEIEDKYSVPEEQDYNMDGANFDMDDL
jgi:hypothetical protein